MNDDATTINVVTTAYGQWFVSNQIKLELENTTTSELNICGIDGAHDQEECPTL